MWRGFGFLSRFGTCRSCGNPDSSPGCAVASTGTCIVNDGKADSAPASVTVAVALATWRNANWPNSDAQVPLATTTPAVMLMLGSSENLTAHKSWFKDIKIGDKVVF